MNGYPPQEVCGYDLLVGADGASSGVRGAMCAQLPPHRFSAQLLYQSVVVYRTFHGLPRTEPELVPGIGEHQPKQHLYWWVWRTGYRGAAPVAACMPGPQLATTVAQVGDVDPSVELPHDF